LVNSAAAERLLQVSEISSCTLVDMAGSSVRDILENISANLLDDLLDICAGDMPLTRVGR
jgi:hypothetical protein